MAASGTSAFGIQGQQEEALGRVFCLALGEDYSVTDLIVSFDLVDGVTSNEDLRKFTWLLGPSTWVSVSVRGEVSIQGAPKQKFEFGIKMWHQACTPDFLQWHDDASDNPYDAYADCEETYEDILDEFSCVVGMRAAFPAMVSLLVFVPTRTQLAIINALRVIAKENPGSQSIPA